MLSMLFRLLTAPFRWVARLFGAPSLKTVEKSGAGLVAKVAGDALPHEEEREVVEGPSFLFKRLPRPTLVERTAADLSIEEARDYSSQAAKFYTYAFPLTARANLFYEEVEQEFTDAALGRHDGAADANFLGIMDRFRRELNQNTARLFVLYTPALLLVTIASALFFASLGAPAMVEKYSLAALGANRYAVEAFVLAFMLGALMLLYHWPYKVTQQQNLLGLDNYITSKFSRINQNFQVAKRRAMNVERNMRMPQADALKEEAGAWTVAYQWFAMRLLFCELTVRNNLYQIRRNTALYGVLGATLSALAAGALAFGAHAAGFSVAPEIAVLSTAFIVVAYLFIMRHATHETLSVLQPKEWNRFHLIDLHETVRDHVGEDKLQIVTFRDRNRLE